MKFKYNDPLSDLRCGLYSGFPICCIRFYIESWSRYYPNEEKRTAYWKLIDKTIRVKKFKIFGRIPCPECLIKGFPIKPKPCKNHSHCQKVKKKDLKNYNFLKNYIEKML